MMDWLANLHRYSIEEIEQFKEARGATFLANGTGMYFYSASHIETLVHQQEEKVRELEARLRKIQNAHDKLYAIIKKIRGVK